MSPRSLALVTGSASGLGLACVRRLLESGDYQVVSTDLDETKGREVECQLREQHGQDNVLFLKMDVREESNWQEVWRVSERHFNKSISLLVNNAGVPPSTSYSTTLDVNLKALMMGTFFALEQMGKEGGEGHVVQMSSVAAFRGSPFPIRESGYSASKWAVNAFTISFASALDADDIQTRVRVNALCPFISATKMVEGYEEKATETTGLRLLRPEEVGDALMALLKMRGRDSGRVYAVIPDTPLFEVPNVNSGIFIAFLLLAMFVLGPTSRSQQVWQKAHFGLLLLLVFALFFIFSMKVALMLCQL